MMVEIHNIIEGVCKEHNVSLARFLGNQRAADIVRIRHATWWRLYHEFGFTVSEIAKATGDKDYTTISYAIRREDEKRKRLSQPLKFSQFSRFST